MKRMMQFASVIGGKRADFVLDLSECLEDGVLTEAGRNELKENLVAQMRTRFPLASGEGLAEAAEGCLPPPGLTIPQIKIAMHISGVSRCLERAEAHLSHLPSQMMDFAQDLDAECPVPGPHVFTAGLIHGEVEMALAILKRAHIQLLSILEHKEDFTGADGATNWKEN